MADINVAVAGGATKRLRDMSNGTHAEVVAPALTGYGLLASASATGPWIGPIQGGSYSWYASGNFNGATLTLQFRDPFDDTPQDMIYLSGANEGSPVAMTVRKSIGIGVGDGAYLRVKVAGGTPSGLNSNLSGLGA